MSNIERDLAFSKMINEMLIGFMGTARFVFYTAVTLACVKYVWS